ncbi:MAG: Gx transporter family protein [Acutalibacteraceae bacterium]
MNKESKAYKISLFGILGALALVLSLFENIILPDIPFLPAGAKPGFSNIVTMFTASFSGFGGAVYIMLIKAAFAFITRGPVAFFMSFCGGILSTAALCLMIKHVGKNLSFIGIGVVCAVMHNFGQLLCACAVSKTFMLISYGKYLLLFAIVSGTLTGFILNVIMPRAKHILPK